MQFLVKKFFRQMVEFYVKITYMKPRTMMTYSTQTAITNIVKQTAEYPNRLKNVIRNPKPTNNMTWMSKITKQKMCSLLIQFHEKKNNNHLTAIMMVHYVIR